MPKCLGWSGRNVGWRILHEELKRFFPFSKRQRAAAVTSTQVRDYLHQRHQLPSSISSVSLDRLMTGSFAKNRRCSAKLWQKVQLALHPYLLCFYWYCGKRKKKISCALGPSCVLQWPATGCTVGDIMSPVSARRAARREHRQRDGTAGASRHNEPIGPLWTPQASRSMEIHWTVVGRIGTTSQQREMSPRSS